MRWRRHDSRLLQCALVIIGLCTMGLVTAVEESGIQDAVPEFEHGRPAHWWSLNRKGLAKEQELGRPANSDKRIQLAVLKPGRCIAVKLQAPAGSKIEFDASATPLPPVERDWLSTLMGPSNPSSCPSGLKVAVIRSDHLPQGVLPPSQLFQYRPPTVSIYMRLMEDLKDGQCRAANTGNTDLRTSGEDPLGQYYFLAKGTCEFLEANVTGAMQAWAPTPGSSSSSSIGGLFVSNSRYMPSCEGAKKDLDSWARPISPYQPQWQQKGPSSPGDPGTCHACANATYYVYLYGCSVDSPPLVVQTPTTSPSPPTASACPSCTTKRSAARSCWLQPRVAPAPLLGCVYVCFVAVAGVCCVAGAPVAAVRFGC